MQYQQYAHEMELTGITRKQAAEEISEFSTSTIILIILGVFIRYKIILSAAGVSKKLTALSAKNIPATE